MDGLMLLNYLRTIGRLQGINVLIVTAGMNPFDLLFFKHGTHAKLIPCPSLLIEEDERVELKIT